MQVERELDFAERTQSIVAGEFSLEIVGKNRLVDPLNRALRIGQRNQSRTTREGARSLVRLQPDLNQAANVRRRERQSLGMNDSIEPGCSRIHCALPKALPV